MKSNLALLGIVLAAVSAPLAQAQKLEPEPPSVPPAYACATGAENYGVIASYLNSGNTYKSTILAPAISAATTYPEFEYYLAKDLALDQQQLAFLKSCKFNVTPSCQPGTEVLAETSASDVASWLTAVDADEGLNSIQGFFAIPARSSKFDPRLALNNFYTITEGAYCMLHPYTVHPDVVRGLKPPKFT